MSKNVLFEFGDSSGRFAVYIFLKEQLMFIAA
jgi:hypothetical protein